MQRVRGKINSSPAKTRNVRREYCPMEKRNSSIWRFFDQTRRLLRCVHRLSARLRLLKYEEAVGIKPFISPHDFRHYSVSLMHYAQVPKSFGMRRVGHITEKMYDEQYVNPIDDYERKFNNQVNEVFEDTFFK